MVIRFLAAILLFLALTGCGIGERFLTNLREKANRFHEDKQYDTEASIRELALKVTEWVYSPDDINVAISLSNLGYSYLLQHKYSKAELSCKRALEIFKLNRAEDHPDAGNTLFVLGRVYVRQKKFTEATTVMLENLRIGEKIYGPNRRRLIILNINVAWLYRDQGNYAKMEFFLKRALFILEQGGVPESSHFENLIKEKINGVMNFYKNNGNKVMEKKFRGYFGK